MTLHHARRGIVQDGRRIFARQGSGCARNDDIPPAVCHLSWEVNAGCYNARRAIALEYLSNLIALRNAPATISAALVRLPLRIVAVGESGKLHADLREE